MAAQTDTLVERFLLNIQLLILQRTKDAVDPLCVWHSIKKKTLKDPLKSHLMSIIANTKIKATETQSHHLWILADFELTLSL